MEKIKSGKALAGEEKMRRIEEVKRDVDTACLLKLVYFFFQAEDGIRDLTVTGVQTCALPIYVQCHHRGVAHCADLRADPRARAQDRRDRRAAARAQDHRGDQAAARQAAAAADRKSVV